MNCRDFREIIDSYLSDELLTETNHDVLRHLEECPGCREEIGERRAVRARLRSVVRRSPVFEVRNNFAERVRGTLKSTAVAERQQWAFTPVLTSGWAAAAGIVVVLAIGFLYFGNGSTGTSSEASASYSVPNLPEKHLVNIAAGDHEFCAIRHDLEEAPVALENASFRFKGLDNVVSGGLRSVFAKYELVAAHACKYKNVRFAHVVMENDGKRLSVLVTDRLGSDLLEKEGILRYSSQKYQIARFEVNRRAVFVVSNLDGPANTLAAEAIYVPLKGHFREEEFRRTVQTALLMFY